MTVKIDRDMRLKKTKSKRLNSCVFHIKILLRSYISLPQIEGDGNCLVESIICQLGLRTATEIKYYNQSYMRRAVVMHCIEHKEELFEWLRTEVRNNYGRGTREGPFSVQSYLQYMLTDRKWLDSIFIRLVSSMWGLRITVVQSVNCAELRFRHDKPLDEVDIVLLYNCNENCGHYNGVIRTDSRFLECTKLIKSPNFDDKVDKAERLVAEGKGPVGGKGAGKGTGRGAGKGRGKGNGGGDNGGGGPGGLAEGEVGVDKERLKQLEEQEKELARERERLKELEKMEKEFAAYKKKAEEQKKKGDKGYGGTKQVPVGSSSESEREMMDNPQVVKKGDKHCEICNITFFTPSALKRHVNKFHKNKYKFKCEQCSKGFMFKIGLKNHAMTHKQKEQRIPCAFPDCETTFSNKRALQIHCNEIHTATPNVRYECNMCHKKFKQKRYLDQHWPRCPQNQNKPKHFCEICGAGPYPAISRVMIHKKMEHQWV